MKTLSHPIVPLHVECLTSSNYKVKTADSCDFIRFMDKKLVLNFVINYCQIWNVSKLSGFSQNWSLKMKELYKIEFVWVFVLRLIFFVSSWDHSLSAHRRAPPKKHTGSRPKLYCRAPFRPHLQSRASSTVYGGNFDRSSSCWWSFKPLALKSWHKNQKHSRAKMNTRHISKPLWFLGIIISAPWSAG